MLDFIRDIYTSFRQTSIERVKSPYLGAFVFSWIGFNWQMLAILLLSKKAVEDRIELINKNFDIGDYLLGPIITAGLIVIILPQLNKLITKIQDKPNIETITLSLNSKIEIAELQQALAESEARKKLAEKKEERFIEDGIHAIKKELDATRKAFSEQREEMKTSISSSNQLKGELANANSQLRVEHESNAEIRKELILEKENNRILGDKLIELTSNLNEINGNVAKLKETAKQTIDANDSLKDSMHTLMSSINSYRDRYPNIIRTHRMNGKDIFSIDKKARHILNEVNAYLDQPPSEREGVQLLSWKDN